MGAEAMRLRSDAQSRRHSSTDDNQRHVNTPLSATKSAPQTVGTCCAQVGTLPPRAAGMQRLPTSFSLARMGTIGGGSSQDSFACSLPIPFAQPIELWAKHHVTWRSRRSTQPSRSGPESLSFKQKHSKIFSQGIAKSHGLVQGNDLATRLDRSYRCSPH